MIDTAGTSSISRFNFDDTSSGTTYMPSMNNSSGASGSPWWYLLSWTGSQWNEAIELDKPKQTRQKRYWENPKFQFKKGRE